MWGTPDGERILMGVEARLFREALAVLVGYVRDEEADEGEAAPWESGIPVFDRLQRGQKLALLAEVAMGLLRDEEAMPKLTAVREAVVAVVFGVIRDMVQLEIDDREVAGNLPTRRQLVLDACCERGLADELPEVGCGDFHEWEILVECLESGLLWDDDWLDAELHSRVNNPHAAIATFAPCLVGPVTAVTGPRTQDQQVFNDASGYLVTTRMFSRCPPHGGIGAVGVSCENTVCCRR